jgi:hypothetical protein
MLASQKNQFSQKYSFTTDGDISYLNITLTNNEKTSISADTIINFPANLIDPDKKWNSAIDRFTIQGSSVPILIFQDNTYYVTLSYNGTSQSQPLVYTDVIDQSNNQLIPNSIFSYQQIALLITDAMYLAFTALKTLQPALAATTAPFVVFNTDNQKFQIYADSTFYDETLTTPVYLYYNSSLYYLFNNYLVQFISENNTVNLHQDYRIAIRDMGAGSNTKLIGATTTYNVNTTFNSGTGATTGTNTEVSTGGITYFLCDQEYSNTSTLTQPQLINIYSTTIGIKPELTVPTNTSTLNGLVDQNFASGGIPTAYLIADLAPNFSNGDPSQWRSVISYVPFYRRWHNMVAKPDFKTADISIKWEDAQGIEYYFYIEPQGCFTIKFVFQERK